jgi:EAL domain-containing protein (putative c-di-GMP-specific phosphodiesterase class I)
VAATAEMARTLGLHTTAEGVETDLQLRKLQQLGIEFAQGYLFSKPVPRTELPSMFLRELRRAPQSAESDARRQL